MRSEMYPVDPSTLLFHKIKKRAPEMANNLAKSHLALTPNLSDLPPPSPELVSVVALYLPELCWEDSAGWETWNTEARIIHVLYILEKPFPLELRFLK